MRIKGSGGSTKLSREGLKVLWLEDGLFLKKYLSIIISRNITYISCKRVSLDYSFLKIIYKFEIDVRKELGLLCCASVEMAVGHKILKICMVDEYLDRVEKTFGKCFPFFKSLDDSYMFFILYSIITFSRYMLLREECNLVKDMILFKL
jgi:hypothetical protein